VTTPRPRDLRPDQPRLALTMTEAAETIGCSLNTFQRHVLPELGVIRRGSRILVPVKELERWISASADPSPMTYRRRP